MSTTRVLRYCKVLFEEHRAGLVAVTLAVVMFVLYRLRRKLGLNEALFANFFTDACGIAVTVLFIERLVSAPDRRAKKMGRELALKEASVLYHQACHILQYPVSAVAMLPQTTPLMDPTVVVALMSIDLDAQAKVVPPATWETFFVGNANQIAESASNFTERYMTVADPELLKAALEIEKCGFIQTTKMLATIRLARAGISGILSNRLVFASPEETDTWFPIEGLRQALCRANRDPENPPLPTITF